MLLRVGCLGSWVARVLSVKRCLLTAHWQVMETFSWMELMAKIVTLLMRSSLLMYIMRYSVDRLFACSVMAPWGGGMSQPARPRSTKRSFFLLAFRRFDIISSNSFRYRQRKHKLAIFATRESERKKLQHGKIRKLNGRRRRRRSGEEGRFHQACILSRAPFCRDTRHRPSMSF